MSKSEHSKTPWAPCHHLKSPEHDKSCGCGYRGGIWDASGEYIVLEMGSSPDYRPDGEICHMSPQADRPTQLADAAFILRAVNAHDELIAALEECAEYFDNKADASTEDGVWVQNKEMRLLQTVDEALKLARKS